MSDTTSIAQSLQQRGIRPSHQRIAIMKYLLSTKCHPTADEVFTALAESMPTLSKATVYNTLNLFSDHGAVKMLTIDPAEKRFDAFNHAHAHLLCESCGALVDVELTDAQKKAIDSVAKHLTISKRELYVNGLCPNCSTTNITNKTN